ncbi:MAG: FHA domain-containing protein [Candidatus Brocadiia bacterium]|jgi:pSer/pThr/pTyr-binding forkhead associated (FHA) protein
MPYAVRVRTGSEEGEIYPLFENREITIGRSPTNNIFVRDKNVSRVHCQIVVSNGAVTLTDLQSTNGTFVNNERTTECPLKINDLIRVGTTLLELEEIDEQGRTITDTAVME